MTLHIEASTQLEVVTEFGYGGVLLTMVRSEVDGIWGVKIEYLIEDLVVGSEARSEEYEALLDNRFSQVLAFPTLEQAKDVYQALCARPKQCTCGA